MRSVILIGNISKGLLKGGKTAKKNKYMSCIIVKKLESDLKYTSD